MGRAKVRKDDSAVQQENKQAEWQNGRVVSSGHWRCTKCLTKISVANSGWRCASCNSTCEQSRIDRRLALGQ